MLLEVNPVILATEAMQGAPIALDLCEVVAGKRIKILREDLKLGQKVKLQILGQGAHLGGADGIEDDLKHAESLKPRP